MLSRSLWVACCALVGAGVVGCGGPKPEDVAERTSTQTASLVRQALESAQVTNQHQAVSSLVGALNNLRSGFQALPDAGVSTSSTFSPPTVPSQQSVDPQLEAFTKFLKERVFTEANVESSGNGSAVFLLEGDDLCTDGTQPASPSCVQTVDKIGIRIRATLVGSDGVDLTLLIGAERAAPTSLEIRGDSLAAVIDLEQTKKASESISASLGTNGAAFPRVLEGVVAFKLQKNGEKDFTLSLVLRRDLNVAVDDADGTTRTFTSVPGKNPISELRFEALAKRISYGMELGKTTYTGPYSGSAPGLTGKQLKVELAGASYAFSLEEGQENFAVGRLSLGDATSSVMVDGTTVFSAELNALSGRKFDVNISKDVDGLPLFRVLPEFDLLTAFNFAPLKAAGATDVPSYLENESYRFKLSGSAAPTLKPLPANAAGFPGGVKVVSGSLSISTNKPGVAPVEVGEGSCLTSKSQLEAGAHELLGHFEVRACP